MAEVPGRLGSSADEIYAVNAPIERFRPPIRPLRKCQPRTAFRHPIAVLGWVRAEIRPLPTILPQAAPVL